LPAARCSRATLFGKSDDLQFPPLRDHILSETSARSAAWLFSIGGDGIMNPRRFATVAPAFCGTVVLAGWIVAWLAGFGSAGIENTHAVPIENRAASLAANAKLADEPQAIAMGNPVIASADVATAVESVTGMATGKPAASWPSNVEPFLPTTKFVFFFRSTWAWVVATNPPGFLFACFIFLWFAVDVRICASYMTIGKRAKFLIRKRCLAHFLD